jgi:hypothetical protein
MTEEWTAKSVAAYFRNAFRTLQGLPLPGRQRYDQVYAGCRITGSEAVVAVDAPAQPSPAAIAALEQAIAWSAWIGEEERDLVWARAAGVPWKQICAERGCDRTTAWRRWQLALTMIAGRLNAQ